MYQPIDLHKKQSSILVVHCSDPRFQAAYRKVIDELGDYYDLVVFPGASKAIADNQAVVDNIKLLHELHGFEKIHVLDHIECGAFGPVEDELAAHKQMFERAEKTLAKALPDVAFSAHLLGEKNEIKL